MEFNILKRSYGTRWDVEACKVRPETPGPHRYEISEFDRVRRAVDVSNFMLKIVSLAACEIHGVTDASFGQGQRVPRHYEVEHWGCRHIWLDPDDRCDGTGRANDLTEVVIYSDKSRKNNLWTYEPSHEMSTSSFIRHSLY